MSPLALLAVAGAAGFALGHALNHGPSITKVGAASRRRAAAPQQPAYCCYGYYDPSYYQEPPYYPQQYAQPYYPQYAQPYYPQYAQPYPEPYIAQPGLGGYGMPSGFQGANAQGYEFQSQPGRTF